MDSREHTQPAYLEVFRGVCTPLSLSGTRMEAQTPNKAVSNKSNGQESETAAAAAGKVTQKNILYMGRNPLAR